MARKQNCLVIVLGWYLFLETHLFSLSKNRGLLEKLISKTQISEHIFSQRRGQYSYIKYTLKTLVFSPGHKWRFFYSFIKVFNAQIRRLFEPGQYCMLAEAAPLFVSTPTPTLSGKSLTRFHLLFISFIVCF